MKENSNGSRKYLAIISIILTAITVFLILIYAGQQSARATSVKTRLELKGTKTIVDGHDSTLKSISPIVQQNQRTIAVIEEQYRAINEKLGRLILREERR